MLHDRTINCSTGALRITESDGDGMPILMLHGTGGCRAVFGKQFDSALAGQHRLIAVDLPGHGDSEDCADPQFYALRSMAQTMTELVARLRLDRFMLLGWSLGGHIAIEMIEHEGLAGLMACGTPPVARGPLAMLRAFRPSWDMPLASKEDYSERDIARFFSLCYGRGATPDLLEAIRRADGRVRSATMRAMMRGDFSDQKLAVERAPVPVALVNGREDPLIRLSYLDTLAGPSLWHGLPIVIEEAGHACFWDQPEVFNELLLAFAADAALPHEAIPFRASA
jgi:pimeloyl-ACP methyl ester carboxylesterase